MRGLLVVVGRGLTRATRAIRVSRTVYRGLRAPVALGPRSEACESGGVDADPAVPRLVREVLGAAAATAMALVTVAIVASGPRAELLFRDGDSLVTTLVLRSLAAGQPQDWAMSTVLFLPETAGLGVLSWLGLGVNGTLALAAVVNVVALYAGLRFAAGAAAPGRLPIVGALLALGAFCLLAVSESSADRDALEPASLLLTTTYYSATVIAAVFAAGLVRRGIDTGRRRHIWALGAVAAASVLTNPLFAAWATVPLGIVLAVVWPRSVAARGLLLALVGGSVAGFILRLPLTHLIANTGAGYADPSRGLESLVYYAGLAADRAGSAAGMLALVLGLALWAWCGVAAVLLARRRDLGAAVLAAVGWFVPVVVVAGAIVLGTHAARYLQPIAYAPVLGLVVLPSVLRLRASRPAWASAVLAIATATALIGGAVVGIPRVVTAATEPDSDLDCVVSWTDASARTGAGQFWTVRLAKAHAADPRTLVQVDHELRGYAWLVNRDDFAIGEVSFLVLDAQSVPFALPGGITLEDASMIDCGRYTIADFGERTLELGPQRS